LPREPGAFSSGSILTVGEALHVRSDGRANLIPKVDLDALSAWRHGEIVFHDEPLDDAVRRMNRYSRLQIKIDDPALAQLRFSGVFEAGDSRAFVDAIQSYLPVDARYTASSTVELRMKS
jgi:transmembrane sensor